MPLILKTRGPGSTAGHRARPLACLDLRRGSSGYREAQQAGWWTRPLRSESRAPGCLPTAPTICGWRGPSPLGVLRRRPRDATASWPAPGNMVRLLHNFSWPVRRIHGRRQASSDDVCQSSGYAAAPGGLRGPTARSDAGVCTLQGLVPARGQRRLTFKSTEHHSHVTWGACCDEPVPLPRSLEAMPHTATADAALTTEHWKPPQAPLHTASQRRPQGDRRHSRRAGALRYPAAGGGPRSHPGPATRTADARSGRLFAREPSGAGAELPPQDDPRQGRINPRR
jgi:hypothetical protein